MQFVDPSFRLSASDLVGHLNCAHLTELDRKVALGQLDRPYRWDPVLEVLRERGARHEADYLAHLESQGLALVQIDGVGVDDAAVAETLQAMRSGAAAIIQAALRSGDWIGRADVLLRVETPSALGGWSYEPVDTKLARETKAGAVLQLCLYAELLGEVQGLVPERSFVVAPWTEFREQPFRIADYAAYFRRVKRSLAQALEPGPDEAHYPEPVEHCDVCRWAGRCDARRRSDDHLSLVAGIGRGQIDELLSHGVGTLEALGRTPLPLWRPERGTVEALTRAREQARIQLQGREAGEILWEALPVEPERGFARLPEPSPGDVFLDFEGDPFVGEAGLEYLFGYAWTDDDGSERYTGDWAFDRTAERAAFECFIDFLTARLERWPGLHIYHYAPYEPSAIKRLMGRCATRGEEVDQLLRSQRFVDLYAVARQGLRASVESYSIKRLEPLYGYVRDVSLPDANQALATLQASLERGDPLSGAERAVVEGYNRDDCRSTWALRDWLEARRAELLASGAALPRPEPVAGEASEGTADWVARIEPVMAQLLKGVPDDPVERSAEQHGRWLLANMLDWHRREQKATWWEYFRLSDLSNGDLLEERAGISGLQFASVAGGTDRAPVHRYSFPPQESELRGGEDLRAAGGAAYGKVVGVSVEDRWIDIKKRQDTADLHAPAVFAHQAFRIDAQQESLIRLGEHVVDHGLEGTGPYQAARDLLLRRPPGQDPALQRAGETPVSAGLRLLAGPDGRVLPIQGPPGAGKTYTGARLICGLVREGKTVAVTANSHKVIRNLLDGVVQAAEAEGLDLCCLQKVDEKEDNQPRLRFTNSNPAVFAALGASCEVVGGTAWLWSRPEAFEAVDVLVVDEAAQMSFANVLAVAQCARTVVLLGDPQQLDQPLQGSHPEGTDVSALRHLLGEHETIPADRGLFLAETWRLHPRICAFTSELFYEGRLRPREGLERQVLRNAGGLSGAGLRFLAAEHHGNENWAPEEVELAVSVVEQVLAAGATWIDRDGVEAPLGWDDVLIIAPYNAQVFELKRRLPKARVGTVDKFQGQEAPLVVYSMTTSSHADAPRGMEFLYSLNRLNVATSRAQCVCLVIASPELLAAECRTPRQMQLVNALCRYVELADSR